MKHLASWLAIGAVVALGGCGAKVVTIQGVEGATKDIANIKSLAVLNLAYSVKDSPIGRDFANIVVAELDQTGAFEVMERSAMAKLMEEKDITETLTTDAAAVSSIGKILKVNGVVVGEVVTHEGGNSALGKKAAISVNLRLVNAQTAQVVASYSGSKNYSDFLGGKRDSYVLGQLSKDIAKEFVAKIAPHFVQRAKYMIETGGDVGKTNSLGIKMVTNGLWDKAQEQFELAIRTNDCCAAAHNNLAVCLENAGKLDEALREYELAMKQDPESAYIQKNLASARGTFTAPTGTAKDTLQRYRTRTATTQEGK